MHRQSGTSPEKRKGSPCSNLFWCLSTSRIRAAGSLPYLRLSNWPRPANPKLTAMTVVREPKVMFEGVYFSFQLDQMVAEARSNLDKIVENFIRRKFRSSRTCVSVASDMKSLTAARDRDVDLIVMASHRPEMLDYLIGPNAAHVARHAACSVLILRQFSQN